MTFPSVYLASQSPRRRELLAQINIDFLVLSVNVDETPLPNEDPDHYVQRVAMKKAQAGWLIAQQGEKRPVLGADTAVILADRIVGKPDNKDMAREMLCQLSGQTHQVMTAVSVVFEHRILTETSKNSVRFATLSEDEIEWYLSTKEGMDKAGGYAVQGQAALLIEQIEGSYSGIMGLPLRETGKLLTRLAKERI